MRKISTIAKSCALTSIISSTLSGCLTHSNMSKQMTILHTDCEMKDVIITDEREDLNSTRKWTAECDGRTYQCNSHEDGFSDCYDITE